LSGAHRNCAPAGTSWRNLWDCYDQRGAGRSFCLIRDRDSRFTAACADRTDLALSVVARRVSSQPLTGAEYRTAEYQMFLGDGMTQATTYLELSEDGGARTSNTRSRLAGTVVARRLEGTSLGCDRPSPSWLRVATRSAWRDAKECLR